MKFNKPVKLIAILQDPFFIRALINGAAAGTEHQKILKQLTINYILDIGANRGQFSLVARKCFPNAVIHSFEPLCEPAGIFFNIFDGDPKVYLHTCAIGSQKGLKTIHVSHQDDSSSLLPIGESQVELFPGTKMKPGK